jgi:hypothetical protein
MQTARTELRDEVRKWVVALPAGQDLPKPSAGVDALKGSMLNRRNQIVEQVQQKLEARLTRIDQRMRTSLAELRSEAGSSDQTLQMQGLAQTLSTWKEQLELSVPEHQGRQVARFASMASFGIAALSGQLFGLGGLLASAFTWAIDFFTDSADTPAELEEDVARTFEREWEKFATSLEQGIGEVGRLVTHRIRSNMMKFMGDMRTLLYDIREVTPEELQLFEQLKAETEQAMVSLQAILRAAK